MTENLVKKYYSAQGRKEWKRLVRDAYHKLEFDTTMHFLEKYLPKKGLILDAGGGPGRYTIELCKRGYEVSLLDLSTDMLELARQQIRKMGIQAKVRQIVQGSIENLAMFDSDTFDGVVCLGGPLSHMVENVQRERAVDELIRVAKRNSPIFISVIGRLAVLVTELIRLPQEIELDIFSAIRDRGEYYGGYGFAPCHFYLPEELQKTLSKRGMQVLEMVGLEGLASGHQKETDRLARRHTKAWQIWCETHLKTCTNPASVGISEHFMAIGRKL